MNKIIRNSGIKFWKNINGKIETYRYTKQKQYPGYIQSTYNDFLYLMGNLKLHSNKKIFAMSYQSYNRIEKKTFIILMQSDIEFHNLAEHNEIENEILLEFRLLNYFKQTLNMEDIAEIRQYDVYTCFSGEYENAGNLRACKLTEAGCKTLAILCLIYELGKSYILEDLSKYKEFRKHNIISDPIELCDTRTDLELSYDYFRVIFSEEINKWSLDGFSPNLVEKIFYYYYGIEFKQSQNLICFRSEDANKLSFKTNYLENSIDEDGYYGIDQFINKIFDYVRDAVNNDDNSYKFKSYSKALCIPLFKYFGESNIDSPLLVIKELRTNSVSINAEYYIFYWFEDEDGNRYNVSYLYESPIDIHILLNKELFFRELYREVDVPSIYIVEDEETEDYSYLLDIDNIQVQLCNFTLDVSQFNRNSLDNLYKFDTKFKRIASYKKDREVISSEPIYAGDMIVGKQETILFIRILYLMKIYNKEINEACYSSLLNNEYEELITFSKEEVDIINFIDKYLNRNLYFESRALDEIVGLKDVKGKGILAILNFTIKFSSLDNRLPEKLLDMLIKS